MSRLQKRYNYGTEIKNVNETLYNQLNDTYFDIANAVNTKPNSHRDKVDAPADAQINKGFEIGDFWVNETTDTAWIMTSRTTPFKVTWKQIT